MRKSAVLVLFILFMTVLNLSAQSTNPARTTGAASQTSHLNGRVLDPSGAVIVGVEIKIYQGNNLIKEGKSDERGTFSFDLPPGEYRVEADLEAFMPFKQNVRVAANTSTLTIPMKIATLSTNVDAGAKTDD